MPKFIQKLATVEAIKFTGENLDEILKFCALCSREGKELRMLRIGIGPDTPKDQQTFPVTPGSWIMRNQDGSFQPCNPNFLDYYEPLEEPTKK